jgi:hypothetical protein
VPAAAPPDGRAVTERLAQAVLWAALTPDPMDRIVATLRQVGLENAQAGLPTWSYTSAGHSLLHAARECYPGDWSGYHSSAWAGYVQWLNVYFRSGAAMLPRPEPSPEPEPPQPPRQRRRTLDDDEADSRGYGHLMVSMTRKRRDRPPRPRSGGEPRSGD